MNFSQFEFLTRDNGYLLIEDGKPKSNGCLRITRSFAKNSVKIGQLLILDKDSKEDPDATKCSILQLILENFGYKVTRARSLQELIEAVEQTPFDALILDPKNYGLPPEIFLSLINVTWKRSFEQGVQVQSQVALVSFSEAEFFADQNSQFPHIFSSGHWSKMDSMDKWCESIEEDLVVSIRAARLRRGMKYVVSSEQPLNSRETRNIHETEIGPDREALLSRTKIV